MKRDSVYLRHILAEIEFLRAIGAGLSYAELLADPLRQHAIIRAIEVIGEAARNLSEPFKERYPELPWRLMIGMGHRMIHAYFEVDWTIVWDVIQHELPLIEPKIRGMIDNMELEGLD